MISVTNDIMCVIDQKKAVVLVLLKLSVAFDTFDHSILLYRLHKRYGITGTALSWFETYLTDSCQVIQLNGESSAEMRLQFGVPQGSVLGPLLFTSYTAPLGEIARRHGVELHLYADDTHVYMSFSPLSDESTTRTFQRIEACIAEIRTWLKDNKLLFNDDKTDVLVISSVSMRSKLQVPHLKIGSSLVTPSPVVRNIDLYMNSVSSGQQIKKITWLCLAARAVLMVTGLSRVLLHVYGMLCLTQCVKSLQNTLLKKCLKTMLFKQAYDL